MTGILMKRTAGFGKRMSTKAAHLSETTKTTPIITGHAAQEAAQHYLHGTGALAEHNPDEMRQRLFGAPLESIGVLLQHRCMCAGTAVHMLVQVVHPLGKSGATCIKCWHFTFLLFR